MLLILKGFCRVIRKFVAHQIITINKAIDRCYILFFKVLFKSCGSKVIFFPRSSYFSYKYISLGENVFIGGHSWFSSGENAEIEIGNDVMFGPGVSILCGDHEIYQVGCRLNQALKTSVSSSKVTISDDVWIGAQSTILKGVTIGTGAVVAAGSVINKNVEPYSIVAGVPGKLIKMRFSESELLLHKEKIKKNNA